MPTWHETPTSTFRVFATVTTLILLPGAGGAQNVSHSTSVALDFNSDYTSLSSSYGQRGSFERLYWSLNAAHLAYEEPTLSSWTATAIVGARLLSAGAGQVNLEAKVTNTDHYKTELEYAAASAKLSYATMINETVSVTAAVSHEDDWTSAAGQDHQSLGLNISGTAQLGDVRVGGGVNLSDVDFETPLNETHTLYNFSVDAPLSDRTTASLDLSDGTVVSTFRTDRIHVRARNEQQSASLRLTHQFSDSLSLVGYYSITENISEDQNIETQAGGLRVSFEF